MCLVEVRLKDCSPVTKTPARLSPAKRAPVLMPNVSSGKILENGDGLHRKLTPDPASSHIDVKKAVHNDHSHGNGVKKLDCCHGNVTGDYRNEKLDYKNVHRCRDDSGSESSTTPSEAARRISIRQTELAYRFKEIVVRKLRGYMHVSLVTHTRAKNAVNPKVLSLVLSSSSSSSSCFIEQ